MSTTEAKIVIELPDVKQLAAVVEKLSIAVSKLDMLISAASRKSERPEMPELLTTQQAAEFLGLSPDTLVIWRSDGRYDLQWLKVGRLIRYEAKEVRRFLETRKMNRGKTT